MGRRAKAPASPPARHHALLGWGVFLSALLGFSAPALGMTTNAAIALAGTCCVMFFLLWMLSSWRSTNS